MSQLNVDTIKKADGTGNLSVPAETGTVVTTASPSLGRRNIILNGSMAVAQRGGSAVTSDTSYPVDRFFVLNNTSTGTFSAQQVSESSDGFKNSLKVTVTAADTDLANAERLLVNYYVEGNDFVAPAFGTSSAQNITLSFQVRSSLTGTFSGSVQNSAQNRSFPFEYTINSADTWETKSVTITGDTTGTWLTDTGVGLRLRFSLGCGSVQKGTVNTWASANYFGTSAETSLIGTNGATWYITGVQLEVGSVATSFEHRSYGEELALCQRYYEKAEVNFRHFTTASGQYLRPYLQFATTKRAEPNITGTLATELNMTYQASNDQISPESVGLDFRSTGVSANAFAYYNFTFDAEL